MAGRRIGVINGFNSGLFQSHTRHTEAMCQRGPISNISTDSSVVPPHRFEEQHFCNTRNHRMMLPPTFLEILKEQLFSSTQTHLMIVSPHVLDQQRSHSTLLPQIQRKLPTLNRTLGNLERQRLKRCRLLLPCCDNVLEIMQSAIVASPNPAKILHFQRPLWKLICQLLNQSRLFNIFLP